MTRDVLLLTAGLVFLLGGGEALVRGASAIARATGVTPLVVGLTIVAFGTSAPELAVNVFAAWQDSGALSFGNIFGSNMANIGLILGLAAFLKPLKIQNVVVFREIPMMMVATAAAVIMSVHWTGGLPPGKFDRGEGLILLLLFCVFLYYTVGDLAQQRLSSNSVQLSDAETQARGSAEIFRSVLIMLAGLGALLIGAEFTVNGALGLARAFEVPEVIIGLTLVALGTSLPELATSLIATLRGHVDLAVGNVVGSNIFNILLVAGATAVIRPMEVPRLGYADLGVTVVLSVALWWVALTQSRKIVRTEAGMLLVIYLGFITWRCITLNGG